MSNSPHLDPRLEQRLQRDDTQPMPPRELTLTPVERPLTATQERNMRLASQEPELPEERGIDEAAPETPPAPSGLLPGPSHTPSPNAADLDLRTLLLALANQANNQPKKRNQGVKEPDPFSGGNPNELRAFLFQCQIYFRACKGEFKEDSEKIFFAISYLRGIALDYFEPFISEADPSQSFDFLEEWPAFVQKLSNLFGSYSSEDDDEDAIMAILFPTEGKAVNYFIQFTKYQNRIRWEDRSLCKVVTDALPNRIRDELCFCHEDISTFEGLKRAVLRIDNNYWKRTLEEPNKPRTTHSPQTPMFQMSKIEQKHTTPPASLPNLTSRTTQERARLPLSRTPTPYTGTSASTSTNKLGPDGQLTPLERQRRMDYGLCMRCGQAGHLARTCPKQNNPRASNILGGQATYIEPESELTGESKNMPAVSSFPGESTA